MATKKKSTKAAAPAKKPAGPSKAPGARDAAAAKKPEPKATPLPAEKKSEQKTAVPEAQKKAEPKEVEVSRHGNPLYPVEVATDGTAKGGPAPAQKMDGAKKKDQVPASQRVTVGAVVMELLAENAKATFEQAMERVKKARPESAFNKKHWAWYRSKARKDGIL